MYPSGFVSPAISENGFGPILISIYIGKIVEHAPASISWQEFTGQEMGKEFSNKS